jgi:hypothetical protein
LKIKKIRLTHSVNKKMVDNRLKKTLKENKSIYLEEKNKNNFPFKRKLILNSTPFQVNKKIKFLNSVKQINKNIKNLVLSSNSRSSNNINNKQNSQFKKIIKQNKEANKKYHSLLRERISKMKKCYKNNSFRSRQNKYTNSVITNNLNSFSMIIMNDLSINKNNQNLKNVNGRNNKSNTNSFNYKTNNTFHKRNYLNNELSFYSFRKEVQFKNLPKINNSIIRQIIFKT